MAGQRLRGSCGCRGDLPSSCGRRRPFLAKFGLIEQRVDGARKFYCSLAVQSRSRNWNPELLGSTPRSRLPPAARSPALPAQPAEHLRCATGESRRRRRHTAARDRRHGRENRRATSSPSLRTRCSNRSFSGPSPAMANRKSRCGRSAESSLAMSAISRWPLHRIQASGKENGLGGMQH